MKLRKLFSLAAVALLAGASAFAQESTEKVWPKIYINPGHGTYTSNDRPMATIKHGANDAYNDAENDTTNFFESNTNLQKGFGLLEQLVEYGMPFDKTKNQTGERWEIGAARDMSQNIIMSHVKCGPAPAYADYTQHTANPDNVKYNRNLSEIAAEVDTWGADMFISIHSNAVTEGGTTNYLYFCLDNMYLNAIDTDGDGESDTYKAKNETGTELLNLSKEMSRCGWNHRILDRHTMWTHYDYTMTAADLAAGKGKIAWQNLGVLNHATPGYLVEGYFHTYQPARHKAMNFGVCRLEGIDYARGVADYFGWTKEETGDIYGIVRDRHEKFTHKYYTPRAGTYDVYKPLNEVTVTLMQGETVVATTKTDDEWNGAFIFNNVAPGDYTLAFTSEEYKADSVWTSDKAVEAVATSIPVTVKAAVTSYPTAFMESKTYTAPKVVYVNYPDSTAGKTEYALKTKYKMYSDGEFNALQASLKDKTVRRTLVRNDSLYVLAVDAEKKPLLVLADMKSNKILDTLSTEGCEGTHYVLSDIQLTADGYLVGCAMEWNQCAPEYVYETGSADHLKYGYGDERGLCYVYLWAKNEKGAPTGAPIKWASTDYTGNWYRALVGETMAYSGTKEEGLIVLSAQTATGTAMRTEVICISAGQQASKNYHQPYLDGAAAEVKASSLGETGFKYVTNPNDDEQYVVVTAGEAPVHVNKFTHTNKENQIEKAAFTAPGATFFKYAGKSLMVAPAIAEGKVTGIKMWDVTEGLAKAAEVELVNATVEPVEAKYASAHGKLQLTLDEVTGNVAKAEIDLVLVADSVVAKFTATPPAAAKVTPATDGAANAFAYGLSGEVADAKLKVNYSLNVDATAVKVVVLNEEGEVVASAEAPAKAGANTAEMSLAAVPTGNYNWGIEVAGEAKTTVAQFKEWGFYHPCGLDVDNSFESPSFGTLLVAEGYTKGKSAAGYITEGATEMGGLYMFDAAGNSIKGANGSARFYPEGYTHSYTYSTSTSAGADFSKAAFAEDGRIFVARYNNEGNYILTAPSVAALVADGKFASLFEGMTATDGIYKNAENAFIAGPMQSFDVMGGGEDTKILGMTRTELSLTTGASLNSIVEYPVGVAATIPAPVATAIDKKYTISYDRSANVAYDNNGGIWYCQYRDTPTDDVPALVYVDAEGNVQYFEGAGGKSRRKGAIAISPDGSLLAAPSAAGHISIYTVETDEATGEVSLIEIFDLNVPGNNLYSLAWDAAGNLYAGNATKEWVKGFAVPRADAFVTKAASKYAFEYENTGIESIEAEVGGPVEYYNLQGVRVMNPSKGLYIKKQGDKATKVVL